MLFNRYADPFPLLDQMIMTSQLSEFISGFMEAVDEHMSWEFYLAKVNENVSFDEYRERMKRQAAQPEPVKTDDLETTIKNSMDILNHFLVRD